MDPQLAFHHIGIACHSIDKTKAFYVQMGYQASAVVDDPLQHVRVCFLENGDKAPPSSSWSLSTSKALSRAPSHQQE